MGAGVMKGARRMEKEKTILFYLCGECKAVNIIPGIAETALDRLTSLRCNECADELTAIQMRCLRAYSKWTRLHQ